MQAKSSISTNYGDVWSSPVISLEKIIATGNSPNDILRSALECGYFSQFAAMKDQRLVKRLINWQLSLLGAWAGPTLNKLPSACEEVRSFPRVATLYRYGRRLSPDLLRNIWYIYYLSSIFNFSGKSGLTRVLEIGSGNGSFAFALKNFSPATTFYLIDIPESLQIAALYLKEAMPDAKLKYISKKEDRLPFEKECDFVLLSVECTDLLQGWSFDLAVNIWSFGEMPNHFILKWFDLIQNKCKVNYLFTLNAFLSPVTIRSLDRVRQGDWLFQLDQRWKIELFNIEPQIHCCPFIRDFHKGLSYVAKRIEDEEALEQQRKAAQTRALSFYYADWIKIAVGEDGSNCVDISAFEHARCSDNIAWTNDISLVHLRKRLDYISHFSIDKDMNGPFFALWNDFRMNSSFTSGNLLIAYLGMITKSDPNLHCTKEEVFMLERLPHSKLHDEYWRLLGWEENQKIEYECKKVDIQTACDDAIQMMNQSNHPMAEKIFARVAANVPEHGDCWYYLACIAEVKGDELLSAVMARHACMLAPDYQHYQDLQNRMISTLKKKSWFGRLWKMKSKSGFSFSPSVFTKVIHAFGRNEIPNLSYAFHFLMGGDGYKCFSNYASLFRNQGRMDLEEAFKTGAFTQLYLDPQISDGREKYDCI